MQLEENFDGVKIVNCALASCVTDVQPKITEINRHFNRELSIL